MGKTTEKITESMKITLIDMYNSGYMDTEIAKELNVTRGAIGYWRRKLNLKSKFTYSKLSKVNKEQFEELFNKGLSDYKIAKIMNLSADGIYYYRTVHGYKRESLKINKGIELTNFQKQVLIGTLLGDSSLSIKKGSINPTISCAHGIKQKEYCEYKTEIFKSLNAKCVYHKRNKADKRNGNIYEDYTMIMPNNPELIEWFNSFYVNGVKVIPFNLFEYFTEVSLAFMYMDDGYKIGNNYSISTNCFCREELEIFIKHLKNKFNLNCSIFSNNVVYIKADSRNLFTNLIKPYICDCMKYKLHN